jgi:DNA modification methylase
MKIDLRLGDCLEVLKTIPDNSIDSVVTDPPYGLGFMGKEWDTFDKNQFGNIPDECSDENVYNKKGFKTLPRYNTDGLYQFANDWGKECFRVLKPGGHLLSFAGSRTYHKICMGIEDAGFEIRDQIMWIYSTGFPKSHNISKSLIKLADAKERTEQESEHNLRCVPNSDLQETELIDKEQDEMLLSHLPKQDLERILQNEKFRTESKESIDRREKSILEGGNYIQETEGELQGSEIHKMSERVFGDGEERWIHNGTQISDGETSQQIIDQNGSSPSHRSQSIKQSNRKSNVISEQFTSQEIREIARTFNNYGSAMKPAHEPIVMARKPLTEKSIAENVLKYGTGGINIDGSRVGTDDTRSKASLTALGQNSGWNAHNNKEVIAGSECGRFPANIIFDEEAGQLLDEQSGISKSGKNKLEKGTGGIWNKGTNLPIGPEYGDKGGASRFFYCPKTSKKDRNEGLDEFEKKVTMRDDGQPYGMNTNQFRPDGSERKPVEPKSNHHPTVKPTDLMRYLINLITPPNGTTLDPFMGSGSTGKAAVRCGVNFIGIEKEQEYMDIASARIQHEQNKPLQTKLF